MAGFGSRNGMPFQANVGVGPCIQFSSVGLICLFRPTDGISLHPKLTYSWGCGVFPPYRRCSSRAMMSRKFVSNGGSSLESTPHTMS